MTPRCGPFPGPADLRRVQSLVASPLLVAEAALFGLVEYDDFEVDDVKNGVLLNRVSVAPRRSNTLSDDESATAVKMAGKKVGAAVVGDLQRLIFSGHLPHPGNHLTPSVD